MILLDTHIWVWWVNQQPDIKPRLREVLLASEATGLGVSVMSCWEVAKLVEIGRIELSQPVDQWITAALRYPGVALLEMTPAIAVESCRLPQPIHRDPADQILIATARLGGLEMLTADRKILDYPHVKTIR